MCWSSKELSCTLNFGTTARLWTVYEEDFKIIEPQHDLRLDSPANWRRRLLAAKGFLLILVKSIEHEAHIGSNYVPWNTAGAG